jgi:hypothetical protein
MERVIKETDSFRLIVKKNECLSPKGLFNIEFVRENLKDGKVSDTSTYQFFMTQQDINELKEKL